MRVSKFWMKVDPHDMTEEKLVHEVLAAIEGDTTNPMVPEAVREFLGIDKMYPMWYSNLELASSHRQLLLDVLAAA